MKTAHVLCVVIFASCCLAPAASGWANTIRPRWFSTPGRLSSTPPSKGTPLVKVATPATRALHLNPWVSTGLAYTGVGVVTTGLGYTAAALAGPGAAALLGISVALPLAVSLVELYVLGGPRIARIMGGKPADKHLQQLVFGVAERAKLPPPAHVFEIETKEMNAFAAGMLARDRTVCVTSGLRRALSEKELQAVVAHEMGHLRHKDVARNMHLIAAAAGLGGLYQGGRAIMRSSSSKKSKDSDKDSGGSTLALGLGLMAAGLVTQGAAHLMRLGLSRGAEFAADEFAAQLYGPEAISSALQKISKGPQRDVLGARSNAFSHMYIAPEPTTPASAAQHASSRQLTDKQRPWWRKVDQWLSTHPSTEDRVEALQRLRE